MRIVVNLLLLLTRSARRGPNFDDHKPHAVVARGAEPK